MRGARTGRRALERQGLRAHRDGTGVAVKTEVLFDNERTVWRLTVEGDLHISYFHVVGRSHFVHEEPRQALKRQAGYSFACPNRLLIPAFDLSIENPFAKAMIPAIFAKYCVAIEAVWKVLRSN
jgi:hypothetical protein